MKLDALKRAQQALNVACDYRDRLVWDAYHNSNATVEELHEATGLSCEGIRILLDDGPPKSMRLSSEPDKPLQRGEVQPNFKRSKPVTKKRGFR